MANLRKVLLAAILLTFLNSHVSAADWPTRARTMNRSAFVPVELPLDQGRLHLKWKRFFGERIEVEMEPTVVGDTVFIGIMNGKLYALNKETGATRWVFTASGPITDTPTLFHVNDQLRIVFGALDGKIYCLDAGTGIKQWNYQTGGPIMSTPSVYGNTIFVGSLNKTFYAIDAANGSLTWSSATSGPISSTSAVGDIGAGQTGVFFATGDNVAYGFRTDGTLLWSNQMQGAFTKRTYAVYGQGAGGKKVVMFVTRKAGREYSEPMENLPPGLQGSPKDGTTVINAWANYYQEYTRRRSLYYFDAVTGNDLWQGTTYSPLYIPYWGEYSPIVDDKGYAWFAATGSGGDHVLDHDERLWKINLETGQYTHVAYAAEHRLRPDEVGRGTLVKDRYYQTISEDIGYYDISTRQRNDNVFGNGFGNHRKPLEFDELPGTIFGGMHKHFTRFGSSSTGGFGGANDATSPLVVAGDVAFVTIWGHLYALTSRLTTPTKDYLNLDPPTPLPSTLTRIQVRQMLNDNVQKIVNDNVHLNPVSRMWWETVPAQPGTFWHEGEVIRTLSETLDYLDEPLKTQLINYLRNEIGKFIFNSNYYAYRYACTNYDSGQLEDPCRQEGRYAGWYWNNPNLVAERIYAAFKYAQKASDWVLINNHWDFIVNTMYQALLQGWDEEAGFFLWPEWMAGKFNLNLQMGAMYAMREMAHQVGDQSRENEAAGYLGKMQSARIRWGKYVRSLYDAGQLQRQDYNEWEDWGYRQGNSPMPVEGYLDKENDYRQPYRLYRDGGAIRAEFSNTMREVYPFYLHPLYTEFSDLCRENLLDEMDDFIKAIEIYNPWWYMSDYSHQVVVGSHEEESLSPIAASDIFQDKAYIFNEKFEELAPYLPWTFENYGHKDIYRLQNLVALLHNSPAAPAAPRNLRIMQ
jgi:outer membrane protein assembly factor BamB